MKKNELRKFLNKIFTIIFWLIYIYILIKYFTERWNWIQTLFLQMFNLLLMIYIIEAKKERRILIKTEIQQVELMYTIKEDIETIEVEDSDTILKKINEEIKNIKAVSEEIPLMKLEIKENVNYLEEFKEKVEKFKNNEISKEELKKYLNERIL